MRVLLIKLLLAIFYFPSAIMASEGFYLRLPENVLKIIEIDVLNGMRVTSSCAKNANTCRGMINQKIKTQKKIYSTEPFLGHPASEFCQNIGGKNLILEDKNINQYDFCFFDNSYGVDSWQLFKKYKK